MDPSNGFKAKGSFGVPQEMMDNLERGRGQNTPAPRVPAGLDLTRTPGGAPENLGVKPGVNNAPVDMQKMVEKPAEKAPPVVTEKTQEEIDAMNLEKYQKEMMRIKADAEKRLGISLTIEDAKNYIFMGRLTKEVIVIPDLMKCTFQTLTPVETMAIDARMAKFREKEKFTQDGYTNEQTIITLSYVWTHSEGKPMGSSPEHREQRIRQFAVHVIDAVTAAHTDFNFLVKASLEERSFLKK